MSQAGTTKVFHNEADFLPIIYEANFTVDLEIFDDFSNWLQDHLRQTINDNPGFRDAEVFERQPGSDEGDISIKHPDRVHRYITVFFEVDNRDSIDRYLAEAPKIQETLREKFNQKNALVISSRRILYPVSLWAKANTVGGKK
ncbi:3171_t:CDS:2 [Ambispora gerdemannii]|uniref:3171_t:CDS:1 n=1 Tax=Ambispora gerdemannii TaxID=144530 RepID=A0A9N9ALI4_9GLOM|nr:3171_t:CDS:2 [Ambispora gerdemannii]